MLYEVITEEDDALVASEACEIGVAMAGTPGTVHYEDALAAEAALVQQRLDAGLV